MLLTQCDFILTDVAKFSVAVRGYTDEDADMLCLDLYIDFVSLVSDLFFLMTRISI